MGLPVLAVYALILQAFLVGATPAAAFDPSRAPLCSEVAAGQGQTGPSDTGGPHGACECLAHCSGSAFSGLILSGAAQTPPVRDTLAARLAPQGDESRLPRLRSRGPRARAPPLA